MEKETIGTVLSAHKQWWLKINTKPVRLHALDGAVFPYIIRVAYTVDGQDYVQWKWIGAGKAVPGVGSKIRVLYRAENPKKAKIL